MRRRPSTIDAPCLHARRGFTLLEILLSLALISLVLIAVGMAVDFQLRVVESSRSEIEEAQLARVLLQRIAADLRGAVPSDPLDLKTIMDEATSAAAAAAEDAGQLDVSSGEEAPTGQGTGDSEDDTDDLDASDMEYEDPSEPDAVESGAPGAVPGVYGGVDWLQVDISRLPRLDQFEQQLTATDAATSIDRLSDIKTVSYSLVSDEDAAGSTGADSGSGGGLVRRQLDRAAASFASDQGTLTDTDVNLGPLAPEVSAITFSYFDGTEWLEEWDSDEMGGLPKAIEITITLRRIDETGGVLSSLQTSSAATEVDEETPLVYRRVVYLPAQGCTSCGTLEEELGEISE